MENPTKQELLETVPVTYDTERLQFEGLRGDVTRHLSREELLSRLHALHPAPRDIGVVEHMVARTKTSGRILHESALLTVDIGMPEDRWQHQEKYGPNYQLATTRSDVAALIANGQPLALHGDNLFLHLDLSRKNLPTGSQLRVGEALLEVTPTAHNGCKKWVQRFGLAAMRLNLSPEMADWRLRGIYLRVIEEGVVRVGDEARVVHRKSPHSEA